MAKVLLQDITKVFPGGAVAVDHVDLDVADGEFIVLVGPSGCGKSTLLRIVAGLEDVTSGSVWIGDQQVDGLPPKDRDIAMVFQNYALYPHMSVDENLSFSLRIAHTPKEEIHTRVEETAQVLGLEDLLERKPSALSGGQRQRVAMGRATVRRPAVFLMDEPLSNLDAKLRVAMRGELTRLHQRYGTTTLYVTHDQIEAMTLGDRIAVLDQGRLQQVGTPDEVYSTPRNTFVAGFIGSPAMNLTRVGLRADASTLVMEIGPYHWIVPTAQLARRPGLRSYVGRDLILGLRPTAFLSNASRDTAAPLLSVEAVAVESLGSEKNVLFVAPGSAITTVAQTVADEDAAGALWTARVAADTSLRLGDKVELTVDLNQAHFFDPDSTEALATVREKPGAA